MKMMRRMKKISVKLKKSESKIGAATKAMEVTGSTLTTRCAAMAKATSVSAQREV